MRAWPFLLLVAAPAHAGQVDTELAADFFHADSRVDGGARLSAQELGLRLRVDLEELEDRLEVHVDYQAREPIGGDFENATHRLLYRAELRYALLEDRLVLGLGRFIPNAAVLLPVDGLNAELRLDHLRFTAFGGRRGIDTSRKNVSFGRLLPAAGLGARYQDEALSLELGGAWSRNDVFMTQARDFHSQEYDALGAFFDGTYRPIRALMLGLSASLLQRAAFYLGPGWNALDLEVQALDLFGARGFVEYRPLPELRFRYSAQHQSVEAFRAGVRDTLTGELRVTSSDPPRFLDNRLDLAWRFFALGWLRGELRHRIRSDRKELRAGGSLELDDVGLGGLYAKARILFEGVGFDEDAPAKPELDRLLWMAALGYRGEDYELEAGARYIDRSGSPVSGRADAPAEIADLAPFVLEAQRVLFLRAFYDQDPWFLGLDAEKNLEDTELRVFVQVGAQVEASW